MSDLWVNLAAAAGITLSAEQVDRLNRYIDLLLDANQRMNLTRITDRSAAEIQHIADALTLLPFLPKGPFRLADVGSGGGIPGIPLAIVRPDAMVTLIESTKKKAVFLKETVTSLALTNTAVSDLRAEDVGRRDLRQTFDVVIARAVGTLDWLVEWCLPLVRKGGKFLAMKGPKVADELAAGSRVSRLLAGSEPVVYPSALADLPGHLIVEITKLGTTHPKFPRPATAAKNHPL